MELARVAVGTCSGRPRVRRVNGRCPQTGCSVGSCGGAFGDEGGCVRWVYLLEPVRQCAARGVDRRLGCLWCFGLRLRACGGATAVRRSHRGPRVETRVGVRPQCGDRTLRTWTVALYPTCSWWRSLSLLATASNQHEGQKSCVGRTCCRASRRAASGGSSHLTACWYETGAHRDALRGLATAPQLLTAWTALLHWRRSCSVFGQVTNVSGPTHESWRISDGGSFDGRWRVPVGLERCATRT